MVDGNCPGMRYGRYGGLPTAGLGGGREATVPSDGGPDHVCDSVIEEYAGLSRSADRRRQEEQSGFRSNYNY